MGNLQKSERILPIDYDKLSKVQEKSNLFYDVMKDNQHFYGRQYALYHFPIVQQRKLTDELNDYKKRLQTSAKDVKTHVQIYGIDVNKSAVGFMGRKHIVRVLTQRVPFLLSQMKSQLSPEDAHIILYNSLKGYHSLQHSFGNIEVNDRKIGFTERGQIKAWIQSNFGMNYVSHRIISETQMVHSIFNTVLGKTDESKFESLMHKNGQWAFGSFDLAIPFVREQIQFATKRQLDQNIIRDIKAKMIGNFIAKNSHKNMNSNNFKSQRINSSNLKESNLNKSMSGSRLMLPYKKPASHMIKEA